MIKYALRCEHDHHWDAWFPSISGYDDQQARGLVDCPICGSKKVEKSIMAPSIRTSKSGRVSEPELETKSETKTEVTETQLPVATQDMNLSIPEPIKAMFAEMKERIEKTHDYVGDTFAREVRAMHEGETEERPIYGEATASEVRALIEDEIPVAPLPILASPKGVKGVH
jgi:hypothetical protein